MEASASEATVNLRAPVIWGPSWWSLFIYLAYTYDHKCPEGTAQLDLKADKQSVQVSVRCQKFSAQAFELQRLMFDFFASMMYVLPCKDCREHFKAHMIQGQSIEGMMKATEDRAMLRWVWELKNRVNAYTGTKSILYKDLLGRCQFNLSVPTEQDLRAFQRLVNLFADGPGRAQTTIELLQKLLSRLR